MSIAANIAIIEERIQAACLRSGRKYEDITLMGISKLQPIEAVEQAWKAGLRCFGESRVQEASAKFAVSKFAGAQLGGFRELYPGMELHLVGSLQRNKANRAAMLFDCVQSLDRQVLIPELARHAVHRDRPLDVLLELRTGGDSKSGFTDMDALLYAADTVLQYPSLCIRGLMTIAPNTREESEVRAAFRRMVQAQQELEHRFPGCWSCLSMGMSGDFEIAVEEGSTMLRIGSIIFGERM